MGGVVQPPELQQHTTENSHLSPVSNINHETQAEQSLDSVPPKGFSLKENLSAGTEKDTTNQNLSRSEKETLSLVGGFDKLRVGMDILNREFTTFGDWVKVKITKLADGVVFYQKYDLARNTGSFPWGVGDVAFVAA